jgi:hypothetical protein
VTLHTTCVAAAGAVVVRAAVKGTDPHKRVVITGMGVASVFGNDVEQFYNRRVAGCVWGLGKARQVLQRCTARHDPCFLIGIHLLHGLLSGLYCKTIRMFAL